MLFKCVIEIETNMEQIKNCIELSSDDLGKVLKRPKLEQVQIVVFEEESITLNMLDAFFLINNWVFESISFQHQILAPPVVPCLIFTICTFWWTRSNGIMKNPEMYVLLS